MKEIFAVYALFVAHSPTSTTWRLFKQVEKHGRIANKVCAFAFHSSDDHFHKTLTNNELYRLHNSSDFAIYKYSAEESSFVIQQA